MEIKIPKRTKPLYHLKVSKQKQKTKNKKKRRGYLEKKTYLTDLIYPTPPLGQDMTQGQFLSGV